ncbi:MAG: NAD(P)(+) transhydrogenase (Re/Si-specific) subunit beta [Cocleimonas sp.]
MPDSPDFITQSIFNENIVQIIYFIATLLFIFGLKKMSSPPAAQKGLVWAGIGMLLAVLITFFQYQIQSNYLWMTAALFIGGTLAYISAKKALMTEIPQMIALYNGLGGGAAATIAASELIKLETLSLATPDTVKYLAIAGALVGSISFSGSLIAFAKLKGLIKSPFRLPMHQWANALVLVVAITFGIAIALNGNQFEVTSLVLFFILSLTFGVLMTISMGDADMPVAISLFNAFTGLAVGFEGYVLANPAMMIAGLLVAAVGFKLTSSMSKAMNRPISNVLFGSVSEIDTSNASSAIANGRMKELQSNDAAAMMAFAQNIIIVPGYGMAVAQAQHKVSEMVKLLEDNGAKVKFAIHPVAGRMPGHMNVLLAETGISYDSIYDLDEINEEFKRADIVLVLGANDTTNPAARSDQTSPIFGMPIFNADKAKNIIVIKRGKGAGFSGIENPLFYLENTGILFGDAQSVLSNVLKDLKQIY